MEGYPQLLDLIPKDKKWVGKREEEEGSHGGVSEENNKKLELSLGLPGVYLEREAKTPAARNPESRRLSFGCFPTNPCVKNQVLKSPWTEQSMVPPVMKESSQPNNNSSAQKRSGGPVVGWPPIRSFRKNISSGSCSKVPSSKDPCPKSLEACTRTRSLFVKVNMDGIPIGRKVDLKTHDSYEKLSCAVDQLFRDLLPGQRDKEEDRKGIGEYTLVYEDNEGDRMLVGDVPWHMFISTVKRLRVLKGSSAEIPRLSGGKKQA